MFGGIEQDPNGARLHALSPAILHEDILKACGVRAEIISFEEARHLAHDAAARARRNDDRHDAHSRVELNLTHIASYPLPPRPLDVRSARMPASISKFRAYSRLPGRWARKHTLLRVTHHRYRANAWAGENFSTGYRYLSEP